ncbi:MAG TPA: hypothetical protein VF777_07255 [Phycisphaerales bacterium]
MPKPSPWPVRNATLRAACLAALLASTAHAQRLKLGSDEPVPNSGILALRDAESRRASAATAANTPAGAFESAYLTLIATLLEQGEAGGVPASRLTAAARKLDDARTPLLQLLSTRRWSDDQLRAVAADLAALSAALTSNKSTADTIDTDLRAALAPILQALDEPRARAAWPIITGAPSAAWPDFPRSEPQPELDAALQPLRERLELAKRWSAFRPGAEALTRLLRDAGGVFGRESRLAAGAYRRWTKELALAATETLTDTTTDAPTADRGLARFRRLAAWSRLLNETDRLSSEPKLKPILDAISPAIELMPDNPPPTPPTPPTPERLDRAARWLAGMLTREELQDDTAVVRQLRPARRAIADLCRASQDRAIDAIASAIRAEDQGGDPGVLAAINMHARNTRLLELIARASDALRDPASPEPVARDNARPIADGLLKLAKDVADPKLRDRALDGFASLARDAAELSELPAEPALRARDAALDAVLATHAAAVLDAVERERSIWRKKASGKAGAPSGELNAARLRALAAALALASDIALLEADHAALTRFGGWTANPEDLKPALQAARTELQKVLPELTDADEAKAPAAASQARALADRHSLIRLAAALQRELGPRPELRADDDDSRAALALLAAAAGAPDPRWSLFARERDALHVVCRYWREGAESEQAMAFARTRAAELLERLRAGP